jgi:hypothetical protein
VQHCLVGSEMCIRDRNTMRPAWCCSGVLVTTGLSKALILDVSFANSATTTAPNYDNNKYDVTN